MGRAFDFVVVGVIGTISLIIHRISVELFAPGKPLYAVATDGTQTLNGQARADFWFEFLAVYLPVLVFASIIAWAFIREYRRQVQTATAPVR
jgi:hypothetical protein